MTAKQAEQRGHWLRRFGRILPAQIALALFPPVCPGCGRRIAQIGAVCPQCWGKMRFLSRPYCPIMGVPFRFDAGDGFICGEALRDPPVFDHARAALLHQGLGQNMVSRLKYGGRTELAPIMAGWIARAAADLLAECDYIVPLPLHWRRFQQRGYNQSAELARPLAKAAGKIFAPQILMRKKYTMPQVGLSAQKRAENVRGVFAIVPHYRTMLKGKNIALIDDVYTTGATAKAAARALKRGGAARVDVLTCTRVVKEVEF